MSRNAQTKVMTKAYKNKGTNDNSNDKRANCLKRGKTRVTKPRLGWFEFLSQPIRERSEERPMQYGITFHSQFIIAPIAVFSPIVVYLRTLEPVKYEKHTAPGITDDAAKEVMRGVQNLRTYLTEECQRFIYLMFYA
ncbi:hypothetical protein pdam_00019354 [Pocillopora damicornis]|uniref:Uncharacterized protein n=1 Tax=Pocillopora damicornis TaxID=46731 RepID=A0A3M6UP27_POCDA|nr:hypothetical protein pdam_00019354 [Pocillopora damicornis]